MLANLDGAPNAGGACPRPATPQRRPSYVPQLRIPARPFLPPVKCPDLPLTEGVHFVAGT